MLDPLFFLISQLNNAYSPFIFNLKINKPMGIKDITILSFQLWSFDLNIHHAGTFNLRIYKETFHNFHFSYSSPD